MIGPPRIGTKPLATLCRRLATSLGAGVDARTVWSREAGAARGSGRSRFAQINEGVQRGASVSDSIEQTGKYFPEFFRELVKVGEQSGQLAEVFRRLADHYEHQVRLRRALLSALTFPAIELTLALGVVGILIYVMGAIPQLADTGVDLLGFGLKGAGGLMTYLAFLAIVGFALFLLVRAMVRGVLWVSPIQRALMYVPTLGTALETFAMARMAWAMHVTLNSGMDLRSAMKLSLGNTHNVLYTQHIDRVLRAIRSGREIHEALAETRAFPVHFIDAVRVGEESGQLVESMGNLSAQYQDEARAAMNVMAVLLGFAVMALIAGVIIYLIYQVFINAYLNPIRDALKPI
ncbi:MAG: type II secretion system F family protein [Pirellulales bacterium]